RLDPVQERFHRTTSYILAVERDQVLQLENPSFPTVQACKPSPARLPKSAAAPQVHSRATSPSRRRILLAPARVSVWNASGLCADTSQTEATAHRRAMSGEARSRASFRSAA